MAVLVVAAEAVLAAPVASAWLAVRASASREDRASVLDWDRAREPERDQELVPAADWASGQAMGRATAWARTSFLTVRSGSTMAFPCRHTRPRSPGRAPEPERQKLT